MGDSMSTISGAVLLLAVLAGVFALCWHGSITGGAALGVVGTVIGIAGGAFAVHSGVKAGATAAVAPTALNKEDN